MTKVSVTIDGINVLVPSGSTILDAATLAGIRIPTLCYLKDKNVTANCRMCVVEVKGMQTLQPSCAAKAMSGMEIWTNTTPIRDARKMNLELILSNHSWDCHHCLRIGNYTVAELDKTLCSYCFFCDCVKDGDCELQALAEEYDVNQLPFNWNGELYPLDESTGAVVRNPNKCIKCRRCIEVCKNEQTVNALGLSNRGASLQVVPTLGKRLADSSCVSCGKCIDVCPTGAIYAKEQIDEMLYTVRLETAKKTIAQISPAIRMELSRLLDMDERDIDLKKLVAGLHKIGIDYIVSDTYASSFARSEAVDALNDAMAAQDATIVLSDSMPAINFLLQKFPDLSHTLVVSPSPEQQFGKIAKSEWAQENGISAENICTITLSENCSYKAEALQQQMQTDSTPNVDFVLTPREIARMLNKTAVDIALLEPHEFDSLGMKQPPRRDDWMPLFDYNKAKASSHNLDLQIDGKQIKAAIAHNLGDTRRLLEEIQSGASRYRIVRICS